MHEADLRDANLSWTNISGANLSGVNLSWANLSGSNLSDAYMSGANLHEADLRDANLSDADLRDANLSGANLSGANLSGANLTRGIRIVTVAGVGSCRRMTTYRADTDEAWCGCFKGTLQQFAEKIEQTHKENRLHLSDYRAVVAMLEAFKKGGA
jgi:hypothetical protein